jgi:general L-amino acid transport system permease protein
MAAQPAPVQPSSMIPAFLRNERVLQISGQILFAILVFVFLTSLAGSILSALAARNLTPNAAFLGDRAGFDIADAAIAYTSDSTYGQAIAVGILNTLRVVVLGLILTTILGIFMGIFLLSSNWVIRTIARVYVELLRNVPLLVQLFAWYFIGMFSLPEFRQALTIPPEGILTLFGSRLEIQPLAIISIRGFVFPEFLPTPRFSVWIALVIAAIVIALVLWFVLGRNSERTGRQYPRFRYTLFIVVGTMLIAWLVLTFTASLPATVPVTDNDGNAQELSLAEAWPLLRADGDTKLQQQELVREPLYIVPPQQGINRSGLVTGLRYGSEIKPEYMALLLGLTVYTSAFIAEIVRAGIMAVPKGQIEASRALGFSTPQTLGMIIIPQALRVIIPPLGNQYLNLAKNSSLGIVVAFSDLYQIAQTSGNQSGRSVEVVLIMMAVYLAMSLTISLLANLANRRFRLVTR